jgi:N6-L-threonylcarbamoyladenine synthase
MDKLKPSVKETGINQIAMAEEYQQFWYQKTLKEAENKYKWKTFVPKFEYTTDNAAMIGIVVIKVFITKF